MVSYGDGSRLIVSFRWSCNQKPNNRIEVLGKWTRFGPDDVLFRRYLTSRKSGDYDYFVKGCKEGRTYRGRIQIDGHKTEGPEYKVKDCDKMEFR